MVFCLKLNAAYLAGNITYSWLSGYTYKIKLTTYTPIGSANLYDPCQDSICFGDGTFAVLIRNNGINCTGPCAPACDGNPISPFINMNEYETTHTYSGPGNYIICFYGPNRNANVINISNSVNQAMAFQSLLVIPTFSTGKNTSSLFTNHPIESGCMNNGCFTYNPGATDLEGDSLSYEILPCRGASGIVPGYSYPYAGASGTFSIDPVTGTLNWCNPQMAGEYSVVVLIKEWRKKDNGTYFLIGYVERDTYLSVTSCTGSNDLFEKENLISVFPNPVIENLNITFNQNSEELFTVELCDVTGRNIKTVITKESTIQFQTEHITPGIYFLKITGNKNTSLIKKIIKQ